MTPAEFLKLLREFELDDLIDNHNSPTDVAKLNAFRKTTMTVLNDCVSEHIRVYGDDIRKNLMFDMQNALEGELQDAEDKKAEDEWRKPKKVFLFPSSQEINDEIRRECQAKIDKYGEEQQYEGYKIIQEDIVIDDEKLRQRVFADRAEKTAAIVNNLIAPLINAGEGIQEQDIASLTRILDRYEMIPLNEKAIEPELVEQLEVMGAGRDQEKQSALSSDLTLLRQCFQSMQYVKTSEHNNAINDMLSMIDQFEQYYAEYSFSEAVAKPLELVEQGQNLDKIKSKLNDLKQKNNFSEVYSLETINFYLSELNDCVRPNIKILRDNLGRMTAADKQQYQALIRLYRDNFNKFDPNYFGNDFAVVDDSYKAMIREHQAACASLKERIQKHLKADKNSPFVQPAIRVLGILQSQIEDLNGFLENGISVVKEDFYSTPSTVLAQMKDMMHKELATMLEEERRLSNSTQDLRELEQLLIPCVEKTSSYQQNKEKYQKFSDDLDKLIVEMRRFGDKVSDYKADYVDDCIDIIEQSKKQIQAKIDNDNEILLRLDEPAKVYLTKQAERCENAIKALQIKIPEHHGKITLFINYLKNAWRRLWGNEEKPLPLTKSAKKLQETIRGRGQERRDLLERAGHKLSSYRSKNNGAVGG